MFQGNTQPPQLMQPEQPGPTQHRPAPRFRQNIFVVGLAKRVVRIVVTWNVVVICVIGTIVVFAAFAGFLADSSGDTSFESYQTVYGDGANQFLSIPINGVIVGSDASGSNGVVSDGSQTYGYAVKDLLYQVAKADDIKGVILDIDSPGGTIYGAHAIADGVQYYRDKTHKPVYAIISGTGASGAYWAASSTDKIYIDYGSAAGSIGVVMGPFEYYDKVTAVDGGIYGGGVVTQNGVQSVTITAGKSKDIGNPYRKLTDSEVAMLQKTVDNEYAGFVSYVSSRRDIPEATIRDQIGAMEYDSKTAKDLKLVDDIGSRQDAYTALANAGKHKDDYKIVRQKSYDSSLKSSIWSVVTRQPQPKAQAAEPTDLCSLSQVSLAYHGDVSQWCAKD